MEPRVVAGVVLAGGNSSRMGGQDKCLAPLAGRAVVAYVIARLEPQVATLALNANVEPSRFAGFGLPIIADRIAGHAVRSQGCMPRSFGQGSAARTSAMSSRSPAIRRFCPMTS
jgi:molybdopterin-guanine dinucleotide biosynthesis protein A